jgi:hypothetical protein
VFDDVDNDGLFEPGDGDGDVGLSGVTVILSGEDDLGTVNRSVVTLADGTYSFADVRPGDYSLTAEQAATLLDGRETAGSLGGTVDNSQDSNTISGITVVNGDADATGYDFAEIRPSDVLLTLPGASAVNYNFAERPAAGGDVIAGQTATIGFWHNNNGQGLIKSLNGGAASTQLGNWLAATFSNMYGASAGANDLTGASNSDVAELYLDLFRRKKKEAVQLGLGGPVKTDAQVLATALAVYVTNSTLAGTTAEAWGFVVTTDGLGISTFNVGDAGAAFDEADDSDVTVLDLLLATNNHSFNGVLYDEDGDDDADDSFEKLLRTLANNVYSTINEQGDI